MNEVLHAIFARAGVKEYLDTPVEQEKLHLLLQAGMAAPNAYNRQAWHFTAVSDKHLLEQIDRLTFAKMVEKGSQQPDSGYRPLYGAPALIIVSSSRENPFAKQDCSCANQNMALAAVSLGLATRFLDIPNMAFAQAQGETLKRLCCVPQEYETVCFLCVGYPKDAAYRPTPKQKDFISFVE